MVDGNVVYCKILGLFISVVELDGNVVYCKTVLDISIIPKFKGVVVGVPLNEYIIEM
jgi:hypothetical protein